MDSLISKNNENAEKIIKVCLHFMQSCHKRNEPFAIDLFNLLDRSDMNLMICIFYFSP